MLRNISLFRRFQIIFALTAIVILFSVSTLMSEQFEAGFFDASEMNLLLEGADYEAQYRKNPNTPLPNRKYLQSYLGWDSVPKAVQHDFPRSEHHDWEAEMQFLDGPGDAGLVALLMPYPLPNSDKKLYLYQSFDPHEHSAKHDGDNLDEYYDLILQCVLGLIVLVVVSGLSFITTRNLLKPLQALQSMALQLEQNQTIDTLPEDIRNDEIGAVARQLQASVAKVHDYHQREAWFLRHASHELRTPISITRSALDIIELRQRLGNENVETPLKQIRDANKDMSSLTQTLLYMARESGENQDQEDIHFHDVLERLVEQHRYLLNDSEREIKIHSDNPGYAFTNPTLCNIVLANLIRNAFEHSNEGAIDIYIEGKCVRIKNRAPFPELAPDKHKGEHGYGLGLDITQQIANRQDWTLAKIEDDPSYVHYQICFDSTRGEPQ